jgi:uncharacterized protein (DUF362 family)
MHPLDRRGFLKLGAILGAGLGLGAGRGVRAEPADAPALVKARGKDPARLVRRAFEALGGAGRFVRPGAWVVVKPNASFANAPEWGNNTHPAVVAEVCKLCREAGARRVSVVDYPLFRGAEALEENGVAQAVRGLGGVELRVLGEAHHFRKLSVPGGLALAEVELAREALDADLVINLPVAKAHDAVAASIGLKNLMGLIRDRAVFHTDLDIQQAIADLARAVRPGLTLVDMTRCMVTHGPKGPGQVETPELLLAGQDPVALDALALEQVRFNGRKLRPRQLKYLVQAHQAGLGELDLARCRVLEVDA